MVRTKRKLPAAAQDVAKERRRQVRRPPAGSMPLDALVAKPPIPALKSKHHSYFELVENKDKKKRLIFQTTHDRYPPRGCEFVPVGHPELTTACKELSRERGVEIYIVSMSHVPGATRSFAYQMNRIGYHFQRAIVNEARATIGGLCQQLEDFRHGEPEPIPESQALYHLQADAALRDLFPRIPHTDRQMIVQHAFTRDTRSRGEERERVGLQPDISLARRVQLAVLAHIRHSHTRYDELLKQRGWHEARKAVEKLCLDVLVKWRGDEETGRDQLDEILREVVVISDSEDSEDDQLEQDSATSVVELDTPNNATASHRSSRQSSRPTGLGNVPQTALPRTPEPFVPPRPTVTAAGATDQGCSTDRRARRGFQRYRRAWDEAIRRRDDAEHFVPARDGRATISQRVENGLHGSQSHLTHPAHNGYHAQSSAMCSRQPGDAPAAPGRAVYGELVPVAAREPSITEVGPYRQRPPVGHRFRDMLVRSVEPASLEPGFSPVASGMPGLAGGCPASLSTHPGSYYRQSRAPSPAHQPRLGECSSSGRRVISDPWPQGRALPGGPWAEGSAQPIGSRDLPSRCPDGRGDAEPVASSPHMPRVHEAAVSLYQPATDRLVVNASWPGTRSNPILMEDRGGFFERVASRPGPVSHPPRTGEAFDVRRPGRHMLRAPEGRPRVSRLASKGPPDGLAPVSSEATASSRSGALPSASVAYGASGPFRIFPDSPTHDQHAGLEQYTPRADLRLPNRPSYGEHRRPSPHREELRIDGQVVFVARPAHEPQYRQCRKRPASDYHYETSGREHHARPPFAEYVDVPR